MKTAIVISGNLRTFLMKAKNDDDRLCDRFVKYLVLNNNADVFAFTDTDDFYYDGSIYFTTPSRKYNGDNFTNKYVDFDTAKNIIEEQFKVIGANLKYLNIEKPFDITTDPKFKLINNAVLNGTGGCFPDRLLNQFRKLKLAYEGMKKYEKDNNMQYDIVIKWRFDNYPADFLNLNSYDFVKNDVYVCGIYAPFIYDWHNFGKRQSMSHCLSLYDIAGSFLREGLIYHCNGCTRYGFQKRCCRIHNDSSDITLAAEYHLFRALKNNNVKICTANSIHGGYPYRYDP